MQAAEAISGAQLALDVWQAGQAHSLGAQGLDEPVPQVRFSCSEATEHLRTNAAVIERFVPVRGTVGSGPAPVVQVSLAEA